LPETARLFFGETVSSSQLIELARDARMELRAAGGASPELDRIASKLDKAARDLRLCFAREGVRLGWAQAMREPGFNDALLALGQALEAVRKPLGEQAERSEGLGACARRAADAAALLARVRENPGESGSAKEVRWIEVFGQSLQLHVTPLVPAELFRKQMLDHPRAWIFTSATLAMGEDFSHFKKELGIEEAAARSWPSPFDFEHQALLYAPRGLPADPNDPAYTEAVVEAALPVLRASRGRAFLLFTSLRALRRAHELLKDRIDYPLLVQGEGSRSELLVRFRALGNAVLLGAASFWEGVDVRGEALSVVLIDKLPFAPPDDPVLAARIESLRAEGGNPFMDFQLPQAVLQLKQGVGRLIRDEGDRGVLVLCDPRLRTKGYGRTIRASLPPMKQTRELADVEAFFARIPA
jgi:ATP-dependent DNA helicase DinG